MIINNKIQQTFSGPLVFIGITFLIIAVAFVLNSLWYLGVPAFFVALFFLFTWSGIEIDTEKRTIRPFYMLFGLFRNGKQMSVEPYIGLTLVSMQKVYNMYSRSNRTNRSASNDYRVYLVDKRKKPALPLKSCKTPEEAQSSMDEFSIWLKLPVYSIRKH